MKDDLFSEENDLFGMKIKELKMKLIKSQKELKHKNAKHWMLLEMLEETKNRVSRCVTTGFEAECSRERSQQSIA